MKRLNSKQLNADKNLSSKRFLQNIKRKDKVYNESKRPKVSKLLGASNIEAPRNISIYDGDDEQVFYTDTLDFIKNIEKEFKKGHCIIDFTKTESISAAALVIIYAAIDVIRSSYSYKGSIRWSSIKSVDKLIKASNLQKLVENKPIKYSFTPFKPLPIIHGIGSKYLDEIIDYIEGSIYKNEMAPETEYVFGDAVSETINNVRLHAYPSEKDDNKSWWLLCQVVDQQLYLAIYDLGVGIPKTVLDKPWFFSSFEKIYPEEYEQLVKVSPELKRGGLKLLVPQKLEDSQMIGLSMIGDVTGTYKSKHGQGSKSIKALVEETDNGKLWIFSNKGLYIFEREAEKPELFKLPRKISGTLLQWNIHIK